MIMEKKVKVLFVTNHFRFSNGVASVLRSMIENLDPKRFDIHLLAIYEFNKEFAAPILNKVTVVKGLNFYFRGLDKIVNLLPLKWLYRFFVKEKYDLEVAYQFGMPTRIISVSPNPNKICWMHTYDAQMIQREFYKKFNEIVSVSRVGRDKLLKEGFLPSQCDYCYNIIDENVLVDKAKEEINLVQTHKYSVITVSRLMPDKACMRLLKCILALHNLGVDAEFWIIGDGIEFDRMHRFVTENNMQEYAKLLGLQKNPYKFMAKADLYFCGSYREGYSTASQESALLGIPVVSTCVDGAQELVDDLGCGCVIENSEDGIINSLCEILKSKTQIADWKQMAFKNKSVFYKASRIQHIQSKLLMNAIGKNE